MVRLQWDNEASPKYQQGVSHGVFYGEDGVGHAWSGLIGVTEKPQTNAPTPVYNAMGEKYDIFGNIAEKKHGLTCYTYPEEMDGYLGLEYLDTHGFTVDERPPKKFHMAYRTELGNGLYEIHILLNQIATFGETARSTMTDSPTLSTITMNLEGVPNSRLKSSHVILDSRLPITKSAEALLFGDHYTDANINEFLTAEPVWETVATNYAPIIEPDYDNMVQIEPGDIRPGVKYGTTWLDADSTAIPFYDEVRKGLGILPKAPTGQVDAATPSRIIMKPFQKNIHQGSNVVVSAYVTIIDPLITPLYAPGTLSLTSGDGLDSGSEDGIRFGWASHSMTTMVAEERQFGYTNGLLSTYCDFVQEPDFPRPFANSAMARNATLLVAWEPWDWSVEYNEQPDFSPRVVASGRYEDYMISWLKEAQQYAEDIEVLVRFAPEMNDTHRPWSTQIGTVGYAETTPAEYISMWRYAYGLKQQYAPDVKFQWNPLNYGSSTHPMESFYPGSAYVDHLALNGFNWSDAHPTLPATWQSPMDVFGFDDTTDGVVHRLIRLAGTKPWGFAEVASAKDNPADFTPGGKYYDAWGSWVLEWPDNPPYEDSPEDWVTQEGWVRMLIKRAYDLGASYVGLFHTLKETDWRLTDTNRGANVIRELIADGIPVLTGFGRSGTLIDSSQEAPNARGTYPVSVVQNRLDVDVHGGNLTIFHGGFVNSNYITITNLLATNTSYSGEYFDINSVPNTKGDRYVRMPYEFGDYTIHQQLRLRSTAKVKIKDVTPHDFWLEAADSMLLSQNETFTFSGPQAVITGDTFTIDDSIQGYAEG